MKVEQFILFFCLWVSVSAWAQPPSGGLTLEAAISQAIAADPWLSGSQHREDALRREATYASTLPDPRVSLMAGNFPTDTFDINQEPMTQLNLGVTQMFPRGQTRKLGKRQKEELAAEEPFLRLDRRARLRATVMQLWLDVIRAQESIRLIENDRALFEHLVDATKAGYASALGNTRQQDIIRAQLELTRLEDRLTLLQQQLDAARFQLAGWLGQPVQVPLGWHPSSLWTEDLSQVIPSSRADRYEQIRRHPRLQALDRRIEAMQTGVELARQQYKPEWGLTAQYGYRDDDPMGRDRADLLSVGISFDVPIFTDNRQDEAVGAATSRALALATERRLLARNLMAEMDRRIAEIQRLDERYKRYDRQLLPQMTQQAEVSLAAYDNDDGDFAEAVRARIAELNARIDFLAIRTDRQKTIAELDYLLAGNIQTGNQP